MNKIHLIIIPIIFTITLIMEGMIPFWTIIPIIAIPVFLLMFREVLFSQRDIGDVIGLLIGGVVTLFMLPILISIITSPKLTNSNVTPSVTPSVTTWNSSLFTMFILLLPLVFIVGIVSIFLKGTEDYHYADGTERRTFRGYGQYNYTQEQSEFEKEIMDMDLIFKRGT